jgi:hypothetical protein
MSQERKDSNQSSESSREEARPNGWEEAAKAGWQVINDMFGFVAIGPTGERYRPEDGKSYTAWQGALEDQRAWNRGEQGPNTKAPAGGWPPDSPFYRPQKS